MLNTENIQSLIDSGEGYNVEFKVRVPSKVRELTEEICAFANADGGYLLIGVDDNGQVVDTNLENDKRSAIQGSISEISPALHCELYSVNIVNKTVWVIDVPSGKDKPYIFSGSIYVREGANSQKLRTAEEMRSFFQECNKIFFDHIPCHWFNIYTDADEQMIKDFRTEAKLSPSTPDKQIFENLELFTENGTAKNGAAMFFGKQPERKFPHAITRCVLFKGTNKVYIIDDKTFGGSLYQQYLQAIAWLESKLQVAYKIEGTGPREEIWEIPLTVFKEAIINALSHRDYYEQGASIMIEMFDDRVEISNPGGLLPVVAKDFGHKSMTRNPLIFSLFTRMHLVGRNRSFGGSHQRRGGHDLHDLHGIQYGRCFHQHLFQAGCQCRHGSGQCAEPRERRTEPASGGSDQDRRHHREAAECRVADIRPLQPRQPFRPDLSQQLRED